MKNIHNPPDITKLNKNEISNTDWHKPKEGEKRERRTKQKKGEKAGGKNPEEDNGRISESQTRDQ